MANDLEIGQDFQGRYTVIALLGRGGMAEVFHAFDNILRRPVAIKLLDQHQLSLESRARFSRECRIIALLNHPLFVRVFQFGITNQQQPYLIMEYVPGASLTSWLANHPQSMDCTVALKMTSIICKALGYAHERGIIHRDLNPNNILLVNGDPLHPKIIDFGLSFLKSGALHTRTLTHSGCLLGTPHYLSPEQCEGKGVDGRTDIYSLGCTLYKCVTGVPVFDADNAIGLIYKHLHETPSAPSVMAPVLPGFDALIAQMLAKLPDDRYQTAAAVAEDIKLILSDRGRQVQPRVPAGSSNSAVLPLRLGRILAMTLVVAGSTLLFIFASSDPGPASLIIAQIARLPVSQRVLLLSKAASTYGAFNKPIAQTLVFQTILDSRETLANATPSTAEEVLNRLSFRTPITTSANKEFSSATISNLVGKYMSYIDARLDRLQAEGAASAPDEKLSDEQLSRHLRTVLNLVPRSGTLPPNVFAMATHAYHFAGNGIMPHSSKSSAELMLAIGDHQRNTWQQGAALLRLARYSDNERQFKLAGAYYDQFLMLFKRNQTDRLDDKEYKQLLQRVWFIN